MRSGVTFHSEHSPRYWSVFLIGTCLACVANAAGADETAPFSFADTPENRQLVQHAARSYQEIDARHSRFAEINGIRMHYLEWGDEHAVPLIWSHGYSSSPYELVQVAPALAEAGYHILAITYRGHGQTQVESFDFSLYTIADDIAALMDQLELRCAVIGGLSLGGGVATAFFASYPERVMAMVLEDGGSVWPQLYAERLAAITQETPSEAPAPPPIPTRFDTEFAAFSAVAQMYKPGILGPLDLDLATAFYSFLRQTPGGGWAYHIDDTKLMGPPGSSSDPAGGHRLTLLARSWRSLLPEVIYRNLRVPMLLIDPTGDDAEPFSNVPDNRRLAAQQPSWIHHVQYPDTPHAAHPSRPEWFIRDMKLLRQWIEESGSNDCR